MKKPPMKRIVLTFGLLSGLVMSAMMVATIPLWDRLSMDASMVLGYTTMVAAALLIYFGVRRYRDEAGGSVSFGRAFGVGLLIAAVAGTCYTATWEVIYAARGEEYMARMQEKAIEKARADGASEAEVERTRAELARFVEQYRNPLVNVAYTFLEPLPVGLIAAAISAGVLTRRRRGVGAAGVAQTV